MILFIDNYDSFTYNLVDYFGQLEPDLLIVRNDQTAVDEIKPLKPAGIVISPGPGTPDQSGVCLDVIKAFYRSIPILGVCLGHQCIGQVFGSKVVRAHQPVHGKTALIHHGNNELFAGVHSPFEATRYHSLIVERESLSSELAIIAESDDDLIMAIQHKEYPVYGVQFHPESILTLDGPRIIENWLQAIKRSKSAN